MISPKIRLPAIRNVGRRIKSSIVSLKITGFEKFHLAPREEEKESRSGSIGSTAAVVVVSQKRETKWRSGTNCGWQRWRALMRKEEKTKELLTHRLPPPPFFIPSDLLCRWMQIANFPARSFVLFSVIVLTHFFFPRNEISIEFAFEKFKVRLVLWQRSWCGMN